MKVIKRNGIEVNFIPDKIKNAIASANKEVADKDKLTNIEIDGLVYSIENYCNSFNRAITVEEIQDIVESYLMRSGRYDVARRYVRYRYDREKIRNSNTTDDAILTLIECDNEEVKQENSNKNPTILSTQRDYMAGEVSKDLTRRKFLPKDIVEAHDNGIIHFHDSDYFAQHSHNCDLVNLEDMLQNGTVISGTLIEKPHSFSTACNIATQIIAQVASSQYGGQSISLAHLAPFVEETRKSLHEKYEYMKSVFMHNDNLAYDTFIEKMVHEDIKKGVQTIQYQVVT
jgi:ribonucleoside-triphosphate reductase